MVIVKYNENWPVDFDNIARELNSVLSSIKRIEHVGSTSIPGMWAKPIIDIDIVVKDSAAFEITKRELENIGYIYCGDQGIKGREAFKYSGNNKALMLQHHLYVCEENSAELARHISFRDTLRGNEELRNEYIRIKMEILRKVGEDNRKAYVEMKQNEYGAFFERAIGGKK